MKIIDEIVEGLTNNSGSMESALLKTKVLAYKLDNRTLIEWVNSELGGYKPEKVPDYRVVPCAVFGSMTNGHTTYQRMQIPLAHLKAETFKDYLTTKLDQSITGLEYLVRETTTDKLVSPIPMDIIHRVINKNIPTNGYTVESAQREIAKSSVMTTLSAIRSKLLDFMLELNKEVGDREITKAEREKAEQIFNTTIIGDNNYVISGDNNVQKNVTKIHKGNFDELKNQLSNAGLQNDDIEELQNIIDLEKPDTGTKAFAKPVSKWMDKMILKTANGTWQIATHTAAILLAEAISRYYGLK